MSEPNTIEIPLEVEETEINIELSAEETLEFPVVTNNYEDLQNKPKINGHELEGDYILGSAAYLDVPEEGNASLEQIVKGDDSRLTDARAPSNDDNLVHKTGDETIAGDKAFNGEIVAKKVTVEGDIVSGGILKADGADYAENFIPSEGCPFGRFVTLDGEKIRLAQPHDGYVLGVTSLHPAIMGDQECEGIPVGLLGKLWVEHDGTLNVNGYAIAGDNGVATAYIGVQLLDRPTPTLYRVMAIDGNMAKILFR